MKIEKISEKQKQILKFPFVSNNKSLIADGAVRSGKTVFMFMSFILWAMRFFNNQSFAICGKTIQSVERNLVSIIPDNEVLTSMFKFKYKSGKHILEVSGQGKTNFFHTFGGKDESSASLIQGMTLSGVLFDEVALMPRSFVEQAIARTLTIDNARLFFNCNPEHPEHWFYKEWILDADGENIKNSKHLHFLMQDNPILSENAIKEAEKLYTGVFYDRFIRGLWVVAEGIVYKHFDNKCSVDEYFDTLHEKHFILDENKQRKYGKYYLSIDYGTINPFSCGLWFVTNEKAYRVKEYYYKSRETGKQKTDREYVNDIKKFIGKRPIEIVVVDPSASSFIAELRKAGFKVRKAQNEVIDGIRVVDTFLNNKLLMIDEKCKECLREFNMYRWDEKANSDKVIKEYDHSMDEIRYFCYTILRFLPQFACFLPLQVKNRTVINDSWI